MEVQDLSSACSPPPPEAPAEDLPNALEGSTPPSIPPLADLASPTTPAGTTGAATAASATTYPPPVGEMRADALIPEPGVGPARFAVVHPHGFRILNNASAMERNMRGYFRLPQPPNAATKAEQQRLQRTLREVQREEARRRAGVTASQDGVVLDGFLLLSACEADDPEEVTAVTLQGSHLTGSVAGDLQFFSELTTLDVSDNQLRLGDVLHFPRLETLHLVCNSVTSLADVAQSEYASLSTLTALDLAYNRIPARDLVHLAAFQALRHLDLSNNGLRSLPADLSALAQVTHLALEANELTSASVFHALGSLPALEAVNLASNRLSRVPLLRVPGMSLHVGSESGPLSFPSLQTITLSGNLFDDVASLLPLAALHRHLRHVAVAGNPLFTRRPHDAARQLQRALDEAVVDMYFLAKDPHPAPPSQGEDGMMGATGGTWQGRTWVRYLPSPELPDGAESGTPSRRRPSLVDTAAPSPSNAAGEGRGTTGLGETDEAGAPASPCPPMDEALELPVEAYLERYRINIQCSAPPPPPAKQPTRFFYSAAFRASQPEAAAATALVTLPPYDEFMDIYRIVGRRSNASRRRAPPPAHRAPQRAATQVTLPVIARSSPPPPPPASPPPAAVPTSSVPEETSDEEYEEEEQGVAGTEDGFFLTSVDSGARRRQRKANKAGAALSPSAAAASAEVDGGMATSAGAAAALPSANPASFSRAPLPRSVVSPASTNVRAAMSELRAMLRKPLPSLPYEPARSRQER